MEQILINLVAGALGGIGAGKSSPTYDLGMIGNIISGLVGGGVLGQVVTLLLPSIMAAAQSGNLSIGGIISQAIAGGAGGAILTALIGAIKNSTSRTVTVARINTRHASLGRPRMSNGPNSEHPARARRPRLVRSHRVVTRMRASATEGAGVELESSCARRALSSWVEAVRIRWP